MRVLMGTRLPGLRSLIVPTAKGCGVKRWRTEFDTSTGCPLEPVPSAKALRTDGCRRSPAPKGEVSTQLPSEKPLRKPTPKSSIGCPGSASSTNAGSVGGRNAVYGSTVGSYSTTKSLA